MVAGVMIFVTHFTFHGNANTKSRIAGRHNLTYYAVSSMYRYEILRVKNSDSLKGAIATDIFPIQKYSKQKIKKKKHAKNNF